MTYLLTTQIFLTNMNLAKLAAELAAGTITQAYIAKTYGSAVLAAVVALGAGYAAGKVYDAVDEYTGIGAVIDDVVDTFKFW